MKLSGQFTPIADRKRKKQKNVGDAGIASGEARSTDDLFPLLCAIVDYIDYVDYVDYVDYILSFTCFYKRSYFYFLQQKRAKKNTIIISGLLLS